MKLYNFTPAANALRVEMFLSEKNIKLETVQVNVREDEIFKEPYNTMNPFNCVPFLELDDGTVISETISICRYLESIYPTPSLFGENSKDVAIIDIPWNGIWLGMKIAAMAEAYETNVAPHNFYGNLSTLMSAHFCAAVPNFRVMEIDPDDVPWKDDIFAERLKEFE